MFLENVVMYRFWKTMKVFVVYNADQAQADFSHEHYVSKVAYHPFPISGGGHCVL